MHLPVCAKYNTQFHFQLSHVDRKSLDSHLMLDKLSIECVYEGLIDRFELNSHEFGFDHAQQENVYTKIKRPQSRQQKSNMNQQNRIQIICAMLLFCFRGPLLKYASLAAFHMQSHHIK